MDNDLEYVQIYALKIWLNQSKIWILRSSPNATNLHGKFYVSFIIPFGAAAAEIDKFLLNRPSIKVLELATGE